MTTQDKMADALRILRAKPSGYSLPEFEALELLHDALAEHDAKAAAPDAPAPKGADITDAAEWVAAHCDDPDIEATIHRALALAQPPAPGEAELPPLPNPQVPFIGCDPSLADIRVLVNWYKRGATAYARAAIAALQQKVGAVALIADERRRQIESEGWTPEHDDEHDTEEMAFAAACYVTAREGEAPPAIWPWEWKWWKPKDRMRNLIRAGALIVAEIERLQRAEAHGNGE